MESKITKTLVLLVVLAITSSSVFSQDITPPLTQNPKVASNYFRYNAVTFGTFLGQSLTNSANSLVIYNQNHIELKRKFFLTSYTEYYRDQQNIFLSNYINGQAFINYKLPQQMIIGLGYRHVTSFQSNISQNFLQFKFEKTFTWD